MADTFVVVDVSVPETKDIFYWAIDTKFAITNNRSSQYTL